MSQLTLPNNSLIGHSFEYKYLNKIVAFYIYIEKIIDRLISVGSIQVLTSVGSRMLVVRPKWNEL